MSVYIGYSKFHIDEMMMMSDFIVLAQINNKPCVDMLFVHIILISSHQIFALTT